MDGVAVLRAMEDIKQVKARYFYGLDHKDWDLWRTSVWAPEGTLAGQRRTLWRSGSMR